MMNSVFGSISKSWPRNRANSSINRPNSASQSQFKWKSLTLEPTASIADGNRNRRLKRHKPSSMRNRRKSLPSMLDSKLRLKPRLLQRNSMASSSIPNPLLRQKRNSNTLSNKLSKHLSLNLLTRLLLRKSKRNGKKDRPRRLRRSKSMRLNMNSSKEKGQLRSKKSKPSSSILNRKINIPRNSSIANRKNSKKRRPAL